MADPTASFAVKLTDEMSPAADTAADSLENLKAKIDADVKALAEMKRALRNMKGPGSESSATFNDLKDKITAQRAVLQQSQAKYIEMGGAFGKTNKKVEASGSAFDKLAGNLSGADGPAGALGGTMSKLKGLLMNPVAGVLALGGALIGLAVAAVKASIALAKYTLAQSGARRSEANRIEGINSLSEAYGRSTASVEQQQAAMDRAGDRTTVNRGKLGEFSRQLARTGLRGEALAQATEAMAIAQQVQGDRGAARFRAQAANLRLTGGNVSDLADRYRRELGPIADRQMRELGNQSERLGRSVDQIFSGLDLDPIEDSFSQITDLFSQSTETGKALKAIVEAMLQPVIDQADDATPMLVDMFEKAVLGGLIFATHIQDLRIGFELFKIEVEQAQEQIERFFSAMMSGDIEEMGRALAGQTPNILKAGEDLGNAATEGFTNTLSIQSPSRVFHGFGENIAQGIENGMRDGTRGVISASRDMADASTNTFRDRLDIASPSGVFADFGGNISEGVAMGVNDGTDSVRRAVDAIVDVPEVPAIDFATGEELEGEAGGSNAGGDSSVSISFGDIVIGGAKDQSARDMALSFREELARVLEGVSIEMGVST